MPTDADRLVEAVARAMARTRSRAAGWDGEYVEKYVDNHWRDYSDQARGAIPAMLREIREPTPEMSAAGFCVPEAEHDPAEVFRAMIDRLLQDFAPEGE